ncbi:MAG: hypothetical protein CL927_08750 [Deltaproteobacteria bacterium]|nr:hypothetical protein [Deltaproteobacteria bacterium]HCH63248.1 hypothetical protein [Deltaproteobacteria bacterium]
MVSAPRGMPAPPLAENLELDSLMTVLASDRLPLRPVVHVDSDPGWRGGQILLHTLATGLVERGHPTVVACPRQGRLWRMLQGCVPCVAIPPGISWKTAGILRRLQPSVLVAHTSHAHGMCVAARLEPVVVHRWVDVQPGTTPWSRWKYRQPARYIACSQAVAAALRAGGVSPERIVVVYGGTAPPAAAAPAPDAPDILAVGACVRHKGHAVLAAAVARLRARGHVLDVAVAGAGPEAPPGLRMLGLREDVPALLAGARVFVQPSLSEGLGMAVVEAMMAGKVVVASRVGGIPEVVGDEGFLVPPGDPAALADALERALEFEPASFRAGHERVRTLMSAAGMVRGAREVYDSVQSDSPQ